MRRLAQPMLVVMVAGVIVPSLVALVIALGTWSAPVIMAAGLVASTWWSSRQRRRRERMPDEGELSRCGTAELCRAWCRSDEVLRATHDMDSRLRVVALRQAYLDELERRDHDGFTHWASVALTAPTRPEDYINGSGGAPRH